MRTVTKLLLAAAATMAASAAQAGPTTFDFALGTNNTSVGSSTTTVGGVTAQGYAQTGGTGSYAPTTLWRRNDTNDHGLGVCSEGNSTCRTGGGDRNELSQGTNNEAILLTLPSGFDLTSLWVSSLDAGGTDGAETGKLYWGSSFAGDIMAFMAGAAGSRTFSFGVFGAAEEGDLLGAYASISRTARYYLFVPGGVVGNNNDYLVWGGDLTRSNPGPGPIPEPATLMLFGSGLLGLLAARRRKA